MYAKDILVHSSDPKFTHDQMQLLFSKEHVISRSNPDNLVCRWDPFKRPKGPRLWILVIQPTFNPLATYPHFHFAFQVNDVMAQRIANTNHASYYRYGYLKYVL